MDGVSPELLLGHPRALRESSGTPAPWSGDRCRLDRKVEESCYRGGGDCAGGASRTKEAKPREGNSGYRASSR